MSRPGAVAGILTVIVAASVAVAVDTPAPIAVPEARQQDLVQTYGDLPLTFVPNAGQTDPAVRFAAQAPGATLSFTDDGVVLALAGDGSKRRSAGEGPEVTDAPGLALELGFLGSDPTSSVAGEDPAPGIVSYLLGDDPAAWRAGLPTYQEVRYTGLWPGVDATFRGRAGELKYEFLIRPSVSPSQIGLVYRGAEGLSLAADGALLVTTSLGVLRDSPPVSYQLVEGDRVPVESHYVLSGGTTYGFAVGAGYRPGYPLVIDPGLSYSTYLGGSEGDEYVSAVAVDDRGSAYVAGQTFGFDFPTTPGAYQTGRSGHSDAFVAKFDPAGSILLYSTFLGGEDYDGDGISGIAVDDRGNAYVAGFTSSPDFPTTPGAFDATLDGQFDAIVSKLDARGATLLYSTYLGGDDGASDFGGGVAVDGWGNITVTGSTTSTNFPTTSGAYDPMHNGELDAFVTTFDPSGSFLRYSTYLGGGGNDHGYGIALDVRGNAHVAGETSSADFPTTPGAYDSTFNGVDDAFVATLDHSGSALLHSTFLGGSDEEHQRGIALDIRGNAYVVGYTSSPDFPTTPGAFDPTFNGDRDVYVTRLDATGSALLASTYLGGAGDDLGLGIDLDWRGNAYLVGVTYSPNFPTTPGADEKLDGSSDAFVAGIDPTGSVLLYSTYLGGVSWDTGQAIAVDWRGNAYVAGSTGSPDFPTTPGAYDPTYNDRGDGFLAKLDL